MRMAYIPPMMVPTSTPRTMPISGSTAKRPRRTSPPSSWRPGESATFPGISTRDVALFDDLLALVDANLCIDDSRVFSTGFSFGAMMSYALSIGRPTKLRGAVAMAAANYNFP